MSCDISRGKNLLSCKNAVSGLKAIYIANFDDYAMSGTSNSSGHTLTSLGTLAAGDVFKFELKNSANTFQQDITSSRDNGTTFFNQVLNFTLTKLSAEMEFQVKMMAWGRPIIFVETNGGVFFVMGKEHGCEIAGNSQVQGTMDSLNGYVLTATGMEQEPIYYLNNTLIAALDALVAGQPNIAG
jgi:hypothetical protein